MSYNKFLTVWSSDLFSQLEMSLTNYSLQVWPSLYVELRWMVPVFRFFEYVNFERKEQKINSTS